MLTTPRRALRIVLNHARPLKIVSLSLHRAVGHTLARDIRADRDQPPTDRSAMDGFALRTGDLARRDRRLSLVGESAAGGAGPARVRPGTCVRILTGAVVPSGADTVVPLEQATEQGDSVAFDAPATRGDNIRKRGEEIRRGGIIVPRGTLLGPIQIGLCASVGRATVPVVRKPRLAVLCTGEELRSAAAKVAPHQIRNSNGPALAAALSEAGFPNVTHRTLRDDPDKISSAITKAAATAEIIIITGGVSVGKYDYVPEAIAAAGGVIRFHGVSMKPGRPQLYATLTRNRHIFGLPGNPLSVLTGFHEFVLPAARVLAGASHVNCHPELHLPLTETARCRKQRTEYILARLETRGGRTRVRPLASHGSADLASACRADGVFSVPPKTEIPAGATVTFRPWRPLQ